MFSGSQTVALITDRGSGNDRRQGPRSQAGAVAAVITDRGGMLNSILAREEHGERRGAGSGLQRLSFEV